VTLRLLLARHGVTAWNDRGLIQGHSDTPLSPLGEQQALWLHRRLARERLDAVYASDLQRCWRTAELAAEGSGLSVRRDAAWRELSFGAWEGLTYEQAMAQDRELAERRLADPVHVAPPGGEHLEALAGRLDLALAALRRGHDGQCVLVVTHGGPLRTLACRLLDVPLDRAWRFFAANAGLSIVSWYDAGPIIETWNETAHLHGLDAGQ
jgi:alpha-ribazole phosphatase